MIKVIIFDFDNTLCDWENIQAEVEVFLAEKVSKKHGLDPRDFLKYLNEVRSKYHLHRDPKVAYNRALWFKEVFELLDIKEDANAATEAYWDHGLKKVKRLPGAIKVLRSLKGKYKIAMLTDSDGDRKYKLRRVKKLGIYDYLDLFVPTDDVGVNKPHPKCFKYVMKKLGVKASECVMIGDHPETDLCTAKKLGMTTIWTQQAFKREIKFAYVDFEIDNIQEALSIIEKLDTKGSGPKC